MARGPSFGPCDDAGMATADDGSARSLALALSGLVVLPMVLVVVAALPQRWRGAAYLLGLTGAAAASLAGGVRGFRAVTGGAARAGLEIASAIVGLTVGVTFAVLALLSALSLLG
jgi:hypothetical protein